MAAAPPPSPLRRSSTVSEFLREQSFENNENIKEMKEFFAMCDQNNDGVISKKELFQMMKSMGLQPSKTEFKTLFEQLDTNGDGEISFSEFIHGMKWLKKGIALMDADAEGEAENDGNSEQKTISKKEELQNHVSILLKYIQLVVDNGIQKTNELVASGNTKGAQAILEIIDFSVLVEMEKALDQKILSKEQKKTFEDLLKTVKKK